MTLPLPGGSMPPLPMPPTNTLPLPGSIPLPMPTLPLPSAPVSRPNISSGSWNRKSAPDSPNSRKLAAFNRAVAALRAEGVTLATMRANGGSARDYFDMVLERSGIAILPLPLPLPMP